MHCVKRHLTSHSNVWAAAKTSNKLRKYTLIQQRTSILHCKHSFLHLVFQVKYSTIKKQSDTFYVTFILLKRSCYKRYLIRERMLLTQYLMNWKKTHILQVYRDDEQRSTAWSKVQGARCTFQVVYNIHKWYWTPYQTCCGWFNSIRKKVSKTIAPLYIAIV